MASACVKNNCSLWDRLVPDLQEHIIGLAVEQHCRELMRTQICPGITLAAIKRNQASYVLVEEQIDRLFARGDGPLREVMTKYCDFQDALVGALDAFLSSIAGLPRYMRCLRMRQLRDVVDQERLSSLFCRRADARRVCFWQAVLPNVPVRVGDVVWLVTQNTVPPMLPVARWRW
jgi:hypothetical protein